ncbi:putative pectate lyase A [Pseudolycoriella hygida]|uniref:Pectate lyase A n=1 Tax=Pseudolycoriella hygida TaxID=35572 RepID=A0A9Q0N5F5_9DIPT|nr:putative pectate lyase A [Pseudolycoriella hygida]
MIFKPIIFLAVALLMCQVAHSQLQGFATQNGGTSGGAGGPTVNVNTEAQLINAVTDNNPRIVRVTGSITLSGTTRVRVGSNKSILGASSNAGIHRGGGLLLESVRNVIIRGIRCSFVRAPNDCVEISRTTNVWIDHCEFWADQNNGRDFYDGLVDIVRGSDFVTLSWNRFRNHYKVSLIGNSDDAGATDRGRLRVSIQGNWFQNVNSRNPSLRFGTAHIWNNFFQNVGASTINSRMGAQVFVENNVFVNARRTIITNLDSREDGFANHRNNLFGSESMAGPFITRTGTFTNPPYSYSLQSVHNTESLVRGRAGATTTF